MIAITADRLRALSRHADPHIVDAIVATAPTVLPKWGLGDKPVLLHFLAHMDVESAGFTKLYENLDYSAARLCQVWKARFPTLAAAAPYAHNPQALANKVYGGRMGNTGPNDGWLNRGQGLLQDTGHDSLAKLAATLHITLDEVRARIPDPAHMLECAAATFVMLGAVAPARADDIEGSTRHVNGGLNGLADRKTALALCRKIFV